MKLTQLLYFYQACNYRSVSRAAEALHISQPSVTVAIRSLEEEFQIQLLDRSNRGFALTAHGEEFLLHTKSLLSHAEAFTASIHQLTARQEEIRLGVPPMIGSLLLPDLYSSMDPSSGFRIRIAEDGQKALLSQLDNYLLDMAFLPHDKPWPEYASLPITMLETVCCTAPDDPLSHCASISVSQLEGRSLILFNRSSYFQTQRVLQQFAQQGIKPNILMQTSQLSTIHRMVSQNQAVGFLFRQVANTLPNVTSIPLSPSMPVQVSLFWRNDLPMSPGRRDFLRFIRDRYSELSEKKTPGTD